jgi:hypothetical protein
MERSYQKTIDLNLENKARNPVNRIPSMHERPFVKILCNVTYPKSRHSKSKSMGEYYFREIKKLKRERTDLDRATSGAKLR